MLNLWNRMFGQKDSAAPSAVASAPGPVTAGQLAPRLTGGTPSPACFACREHFNPLGTLCPTCRDPDMSRVDGPTWFTALQAHVTAVQANDTAVRLFREGKLDDAIAELRRGLEANPHYATGYSNLGFLYLRRAELEQAVECLLRALELDPVHQDAPGHLWDVLMALIDELTGIGLTDGFLSTQPGGNFDEYNRHIRTRDIGALIAKVGKRGVVRADGRVLGADLLMEIVIDTVQKRMRAHKPSTGLQFAWQGIHGWNPRVAIPLQPAANAAYRWGMVVHDDRKSP
jgi:Tetratricopeptide repeat